MRKMAFVVGGVAAGGVAAFLTLGEVPPRAQQPTAVADSIVAPVLSASDTGALEAIVDGGLQERVHIGDQGDVGAAATARQALVIYD